MNGRLAPAATGVLLVVTACGEDPAGPRRAAPDPQVRWIAPAAVVAGETVWIVGSSLARDTADVTVLFDGRPAEVVSVSDTLVVALVAPDEPAHSVAVEVAVRGALRSAAGSFEVVPPPAPPGILGVAPDSVLGGDTLRLRGRHFAPLFADDPAQPAVSVGNRAAAVVAADDTLVVALAPAGLAGTHPVLVRRSGLEGRSVRPLTVVPAVAGLYDVLAASPSPDSCGRGAALGADLQAAPFEVDQRFAELSIDFLGHPYADVLDVNAFESGRADAGSARVDSLLLAFVPGPAPAGAGTFTGATGAFVVSYEPGDRCNLRVALFARRREPGG